MTGEVKFCRYFKATNAFIQSKYNVTFMYLKMESLHLSFEMKVLLLTFK